MTASWWLWPGLYSWKAKSHSSGHSFSVSYKLRFWVCPFIFFLYSNFFFHLLVAKTAMSHWLLWPWCKLHPTCFPSLCHFGWLLRNEHCNVSTNSSTVLQQTWARLFKTAHCVSQKSFLLRGSVNEDQALWIFQYPEEGGDSGECAPSWWWMPQSLVRDYLIHLGYPRLTFFFLMNSLWRCLYISAIFINLDILPTILPVQPDEIVRSWRESSRNSINIFSWVIMLIGDILVSRSASMFISFIGLKTEIPVCAVLVVPEDLVFPFPPAW